MARPPEKGGEKMKKSLFVLLAVLVGFVSGLVVTECVSAADVAGVEVTGHARFGYTADSNLDNKTLNVIFDPDYILKSGLSAQITDNVALRLGFNHVQNLSLSYTYGVDYTVKGNCGVFAEHTNHDMKAGLPDYDFSWAGGFCKLE